MTASALYEGWVRHRRHEPVEHEFRYRLVHDLPRPRRAARAARRPAALVGAPPGARPVPARRLPRTVDARRARVRGCSTHVRTFGHARSTRSASTTASIRPASGSRRCVAEVTNTPWGERHTYVLDAPRTPTIGKSFHVSPFLGMDAEYGCGSRSPEKRCGCTSRAAAARPFSSTPRSRCSAASCSPWPLLRLSLHDRSRDRRIYLQALRLRLKGAPYHPHPAR